MIESNQKKLKSFSVRMSSELYDKLDNAAWEQRLKKSSFIIRSVENYLKYIENDNQQKLNTKKQGE